MNPEISGNPEMLCAEILAAARRTADQILAMARDEAADMEKNAATAADAMRRNMREQSSQDVARRNETLLAAVPAETGRMRSARVESLIESIRDEVRRRMHERWSSAGHAIAVTLAAQAIRQMGGVSFRIRLASDDIRRMGEGLAAEIVNRIDREAPDIALIADPTLSGGGLIVEDADGGRIWDNMLDSRLERLWPELRRCIALRCFPGETAGPAATSGGAS